MEPVPRMTPIAQESSSSSRTTNKFTALTAEERAVLYARSMFPASCSHFRVLIFDERGAIMCIGCDTSFLKPPNTIQPNNTSVASTSTSSSGHLASYVGGMYVSKIST